MRVAQGWGGSKESMERMERGVCGWLCVSSISSDVMCVCVCVSILPLSLSVHP